MLRAGRGTACLGISVRDDAGLGWVLVGFGVGCRKRKCIATGSLGGNAFGHLERLVSSYLRLGLVQRRLFVVVVYRSKMFLLLVMISGPFPSRRILRCVLGILGQTG